MFFNVLSKPFITASSVPQTRVWWCRDTGKFRRRDDNRSLFVRTVGERGGTRGALLLRDRTRYAAAAGWRRYARRRRRRSAGRLFAVVSSRTTCALRSYRSSATAAANPLAVCTCGPNPDAAGPAGRGSREGPGGVRGPETRRLLAAARSRPCVTRKYAVYTVQI